MGCVALVPLVDRTPFGWLPRDLIYIVMIKCYYKDK